MSPRHAEDAIACTTISLEGAAIPAIITLPIATAEKHAACSPAPSGQEILMIADNDTMRLMPRRDIMTEAIA